MAGPDALDGPVEERGPALEAEPGPLLAVRLTGEADSWARAVAGVDVHKARNGRRRATLSGHADAVRCVAFSPYGKTIGYAELTLKLFDVGQSLRNDRHPC